MFCELIFSNKLGLGLEISLFLYNFQILPSGRLTIVCELELAMYQVSTLQSFLRRLLRNGENKLERLSLESFFRASVIFAGKVRVYYSITIRKWDTQYNKSQHNT